MDTIVLGAEFFDLSPDEFAVVNRQANAVGLMACVSDMVGEGDDKRISFELVKQEKYNG